MEVIDYFFCEFNTPFSLVRTYEQQQYRYGGPPIVLILDASRDMRTTKGQAITLTLIVTVVYQVPHNVHCVHPDGLYARSAPK